MSPPEHPLPDSQQLAASARQVLMARAAARRVARHALGNLIHPIALQLQLLERRLARRPERVPETVESLQRIIDDTRRGLADLEQSVEPEREPGVVVDLDALLSRVRTACAIPLVIDLGAARGMVEVPPRTLGTGLTVLLRGLDRHGASEIALHGRPEPALEITWTFQPVRLHREELDDLISELGRWPGLKVQLLATETPEAGGAVRFGLERA